MPQRHSVGARIRERRMDRRLKQADLAAAVGISASYLNLIEHDRRRIGGKVLNDLARVLGVEPAQLSDGAEGVLLDRLRGAVASRLTGTVDLGRAEDFATRFPGWAALVVDAEDRIALLEARVAALTDRLAHDPKLASSLHEVISAVTSIRATSSILVNSENIDRDWQGRFHRNIYDDSQRLTEASRALTTFLEAPTQQGAAGLSPLDEAEGFLAGLGFHVPALEGADPALTPQAAAQAATGPRSLAARDILTAHLIRYRADAVALPLDRFAPAARAARYDPALLATEFAVPLAQVLRRLAHLPDDDGHPPMGLVLCDGAGGIRMVKEAAGFTLPRGGTACPLWPLFAALSQPGQPIRAEVALPGAPVRRFLCYAVAGVEGPLSFDAPGLVSSVMLVLPDARLPGLAAAQPRPVGLACRVCPRPDCAARREPSILDTAPA